MGKTSFVEKLVEYMNMQDMEICMADGNTAFCLAAISGNVKIAEILFGKNPKLLWIRGQKYMLPIQLASSAGHIPMTEFLFQARDDLHNNIPFQDIVKLFFLTITNNIYILITLTNLVFLVQKCYSFLTLTLKRATHFQGKVSYDSHQKINQLLILYIYTCIINHECETIGHQDIVSSLFKGMEKEEESLNSVQLSKAMFDAAKSGDIQILEFLFKYHPDLLFEVDPREQRSLLHIAILNRQEFVYQLILSKGDSKNVMIQLVDFEGNNVLHLAGNLKLAPEERFGLSTNHVLMRSEEIWFQEVEKIVPPAMKTMRNKDGLTPKELFYRSHKELHKESISGVRDLANTFIVVATLIITLGITGAMTIPIKDIESTLTPIFRKKTWYTFFLLSIATGTYLCVATIIFYASVILPSSWEPKDEYVRLRHTKLVFGNFTLFASLGLMFTAIASGSVLIFDFLSNWIFYFIAGLGCITLVLHPTYILWNHVVHSVASFCEVAQVKLARLLWPIHKIYEYHPLANQKRSN
ncbi:hypothetical protein E2542_SST00608 [Spatholobus suberectus]|nr:hypothetical protein E2542_SST00608 [Spatholobus suberectus]